MAASDQPGRNAGTGGGLRPLRRRGWTTAEQPHESAAVAASLRRMVDAACAALEQAADISSDVHARQEQLRAAEQRLGRVGQLLERARGELGAVAEELVRAGLPAGACGVPWPVCSHCLGVGLAASAGSSWCPSCGRPGGPAAARPTYLCTERATVTVRDGTGAEEAMCLSHAAGALRQIEQLTVVNATNEEARRLLAVRDRPVRIDLTRQVARADLPNLPERR